MEEITKEKIEARKKEREKKYMQSYDYSKFQTKFLDSVLEQETAMAEERDQKEKIGGRHRRRETSMINM